MLFILSILTFFPVSDSSTFILEKEVSGFQTAKSITVDGLGAIYVLDSETSEISKFDSELSLLLNEGGIGWKQGQFVAPRYIDGSSGLDILVSDFQNNRIQRLDLNLSFISELRTNAITFPDDYKVIYPKGSVVVNSRDVYVIDGGNPRIVVFKDGATPVVSFGGFGSGRGQMNDPVKIVKNGDNILFIHDKGRKSVLRYDNFGNYLGEIKRDGIVSISVFDNLLYILTVDGIWIFDTVSNQYRGKIEPPAINLKNIRDYYVYNREKHLFLTEKVLSFWKINE